jgi:hypothetical protein
MVQAFFVERWGVASRLSAPQPAEERHQEYQVTAPKKIPRSVTPRTWHTADAHHHEKVPPSTASLEAVANETHTLRQASGSRISQ